MPEGGVSQQELSSEVSKHAEHSGEERRDWMVAVAEAVLLAIVAVMAAWSGYASAKWATDSRLELAKSSATRTLASNSELAAMTQRNFDSSTFTVWFVADVAGNARQERIAERRFTPNFRRAFNAWMATDPATNPHAPPGPTYMPQYKQPDLTLAAVLNHRATVLYAKGATAGTNSDEYVRLTVYLATVLFLVAIRTHFRIRAVRIGLVTLGGVVLILSVVQLTTLPAPPA